MEAIKKAKKLKEDLEKKQDKEMSKMTSEEKQKLQHDAIKEAQNEIEKSDKAIENDPEELINFDELNDATDDWESVDQYSKFM